MPKLTFRSVTHSLVSLFIVFVVVAVGLLAVNQRITKVVQAQTVPVSIDSGIECSNDADCRVSNPNSGATCINGTCGKRVTVGSTTKPAAATKQIKDLEEANKNDTESVFKLTDTINNASLASLTKMLGGCSTGACTDYSGNETQSAGIIGGVQQTMVAMFTNQPANTQTAVADAFKSAGINIAQPAYAQGIGFAALDPILETWKVFRNLAYLFFILAFVVIGFMIMFRQKVGQAAITAQQAIPQIIIALIAVTFSYAIAGLLIDMMYLLMYLLIGIFGQESSLVDLNAFSLGWKMLTTSWSNVGAIGQFVDATLSTLTPVVSDTIGWLADGAFLLIITIAILIGMFRLFFELLKTYITLIISIALAPLILMLGAVPGRNSFGGWVQSIIGNLAAFPTVLLVLIIFNMITGTQGIKEAGFLPPYLFGGGSAGIIPTLVGIGMILALPEIVVKVKEALGAKDTFGWLTSAAFKNIDRGQAAIPLTTAAAGAGIGAYRNREILDGTKDSRSPDERRAAFLTAANKTRASGWNIGKTGLKWYQRLREGRITQVEDIETILSNMSKSSGKKDS